MISKIDSNRRLTLSSAAVLAAFCATMTSCSVSLPTRPFAEAKAPEAPILYDWHGDSLQGPTTVKIHLDEQKAYIFRGDQQAGWTVLASGREGHDSPTGTFAVMEKLETKSSNLYGVIADESGHIVNSDARAGVTPVPHGCRFVGAPMPYWMRLTGAGVGMHAGMIPEPGMPASHGCIRLPREMAAKLFDVITEGSRVVVTGIAPGSSLAGAPPRITKPIAVVAKPAMSKDLAQR